MIGPRQWSPPSGRSHGKQHEGQTGRRRPRATHWGPSNPIQSIGAHPIPSNPIQSLGAHPIPSNPLGPIQSHPIHWGPSNPIQSLRAHPIPAPRAERTCALSPPRLMIKVPISTWVGTASSSAARIARCSSALLRICSSVGGSAFSASKALTKAPSSRRNSSVCGSSDAR